MCGRQWRAASNGETRARASLRKPAIVRRQGSRSGANRRRAMASNGKVALVTGGGSGIGKASALALAHEGFAVVVAGRRPEPLDAVVSEIESMQVKALGVPTDVSDPASVEALFAKTKASFGRLDVLFNNAGFGAAGLIE